MQILCLVLVFQVPPAIEFNESVIVSDTLGKPLDVGTYAAPMMTDWNEDGLPDLLIGQFEDGRMRFYPNIGTEGSPEFMYFDYLRDGGSILSVPYG